MPSLARPIGGVAPAPWPAAPVRTMGLAEPDPAVVRTLNRFVAAASVLGMVVGVSGLVGWVFHLQALQSVVPGSVPIGPGAAVALGLCGSSLWLLRSSRGHIPLGLRAHVGRMLAAVVAMMGLISLVARAGRDLGADGAFTAVDSTGMAAIAPISALAFLLLGLALIWLDRPAGRRWPVRPAQILAFAANNGAVAGLVDFILEFHISHTDISPQTALTLFVLSVAVACARTDSGLGALVASSTYGGMITRWLWPLGVAVPLLIGSAAWLAYSVGLVSDWAGITVMIVAMTTLLAGSVIWSALHIDRSDAERRQAEVSLQRREEDLRKAQEIAHVGSWHLDVARDELRWSDEVFRIFDMPAATPLTYESFLALVHPADRAAVDRAWTAAIHGEPYDLEHRILVGGTEKWVRERAEIEFDAAGHPLRGTGTVQDITERKRSERERQRATRALRALSLCNQALIRATEESAWLQQVCDIIVNATGYRFCWVGRAERDDAKSVTAVARAGWEAGYLEAAGVTWADTARGRGPVGTSIRTGRTQIVKDTATDPEFAPWRDDALKRGYGSVIAIPLVVGSAPFGALAIYAAERDVFSDDEVQLLTELASDLAFGIGALRSDAERKRAEAEIRTLNAELEDRVRARTAELEAARDREATIGFRIQQMLLLTQPPKDVPGLQVAALTIPSQRIDGDFYDFFRHQNDCLDVIVADVMGKGIPAALLAGATKSNVLEALCHLLGLSRDGALPEPKEIVTLAHADMVRQLIELESFVTLSYARLDLKRRVVDLVDCGHTGMMIARASTGACEMIHGDSLPLGIREGEIFDQVAVPFEGGDVFLFYSDGITDMRNRDGVLFGVDRLAACVRANRDRAPEAIVDAIRTAAVSFAGTERPADDLTCVAVKVVEVPCPLARAELAIRSDPAELGRARAFVREFCRCVPGLLGDDDVFGLELAVNEAASNIMKHAYHGRLDQRIELDAEAFSDRVSFRLHHLGESFDPASAAPPAFDGSRESGFGLYLITMSVDQVRHSRDERGKHCISLVKMRTRRGA